MCVYAHSVATKWRGLASFFSFIFLLTETHPEERLAVGLYQVRTERDEGAQGPWCLPVSVTSQDGLC